jgi:hypothetical protein
MQIRTALLLPLLLALAVSAGAKELRLESPGPRVSLLELYTSEGCSSCPPADRWISKLQEDPRLWREVVPVAFHVDYWDYIGWKDRFASPVYGNRQRDYARNRRVSTVYTPGFVLAGEEWRSWFYRPTLKVDHDVEAGKLELRVNHQQAKAVFTPTAPTDGALELHVAILGFDLKTDVRSGENGGNTLEHDFVVLGYRSIPTTRTMAHYTASFSLPTVSVESDRKAIAAWLSPPGDPSPVQAVGGWLDGQAAQ